VRKLLPAGVTVRKASGGFLTTTEPTMVRVVTQKSAVRTAAFARKPSVTPQAQAVHIPVQAPVRAAASSCNGLSGNASQFLRSSSRVAVRCGPQGQHPSAYLRGKNVQVARVAASPVLNGIAPVQLKTPAGYKRVFDDGRLNSSRGPRTLAGDYQMAQVLTTSTPAFPAGFIYKRTFWNTLLGQPGKWVPSMGVAVAAAPQAPVVNTTRVSSKSVAPKATIAPARRLKKPQVPVAAQRASAPKPATTGHRYVQVGTFGVVQNADNSIARLAGMGFPVSSQLITRSGKQLKTVLAGPFTTPSETLQALGQARAAGYSDAFAR
jgi:hypothetical protein